MNWLAEVLEVCSLTEEVEGYLLGRGAKEETIRALGCKTWQPLRTPYNEKLWVERYGPEGRGEYLRGRLITPLYSPRGQVIGFEARSIHRKKITRYLTPEAAWNPVWVGMTPVEMQKIWDGGDVWIGEGQFDIYPLQWIVPEKDATLGSLRAKLTDKHVEFLRRHCRGRVHMVWDNDETGKKGTHGWVDDTGKRRWGALDKLKYVGQRCRAVPIRGAKDPGEIWDRGGEMALRSAFNL